MKLARLSGIGLSMMFAMASLASAEPTTFKIDPNHSQVEFSIRHFFSRVTGRFNKFSGTVVYDDKNVAGSSVEVTIETASIFTNNDRRDRDLRSAHFFLADSFPAITFKSTKVVPGENGKMKVEGTLTMHGVTRPETLDVTLLGVGAVGMMGTRAGFEASTTLDRKAYGIVWNQALDQGGTMLGDEVLIHIGIEAVKVDGRGPGAMPMKK